MREGKGVKSAKRRVGRTDDALAEGKERAKVHRAGAVRMRDGGLKEMKKSKPQTETREPHSLAHLGLGEARSNDLAHIRGRDVRVRGSCCCTTNLAAAAHNPAAGQTRTRRRSRLGTPRRCRSSLGRLCLCCGLGRLSFEKRKYIAAQQCL